jgi:hypothetical protein
VSDDTPKTTLPLDFHHLQARFIAEMPEAVRAIAKIVVRFFVKPKLKWGDENQKPVVFQNSGHFRHQTPGVWRVLQHLNVENSIEASIRKRQCDAVVNKIRTRCIPPAEVSAKVDSCSIPR